DAVGVHHHGKPVVLDEPEPEDPFVKGARFVVVCYCDEGDDVSGAQHGSTIHRAASALPSNRPGSGESASCVWLRVLGSVSTRSCRWSAPAGWARRIARATRG